MARSNWVSALWARALVISGIVCAVVLALQPAVASARFQVGLEDQTFYGNRPAATTDGAYQALRTVGGSVVRISAGWYSIAPTGRTPPAGFNASNPSDPHYKWTVLDETVRRAAEHHAQAMLELFRPPTWAQAPGIPTSGPAFDALGPYSWEPSVADFGQFVHAVAERYSGHFPDPLHPGTFLPRVKDYEIWNEQNLWRYLAGPDTVGQYRNLLATAYKSLKQVHKDNFVIVGGLAPISNEGQYSSHPLTFAAQLMCLRRVRRHFVRTPHCQKISFDALAVHPYTLAATPTKPAYNYDDVLVPDTYKLENLLHAAERFHTINAAPHSLWVTEWSWFTNPPNSQYGDAPATAARYVAYSMYEMWRDGVQFVSWQVLADLQATAANPGGGLENPDGSPKLTMQAFGFPFIASVKGRSGFAWGRAPVYRRVNVIVQRQTAKGWRKVATVRSDRWGVFTATFAARGNATYRALVVRGASSLPYFSARIPARRTHAFNFG